MFPAADLDLDAWRDRVLSKVLRTVVVVAGLAAAFGIGLSMRVGLYGVAIFDAVAWVALVGVWRGALPYRLRAFTMVALLFLVGVVILGAIGPNGAGQMWLIGAPLTAALLSGRRAFVGWLVAVEAALLGFALAARWYDPWPLVPVDGLWWVLVMSSVASVALLVGLPTLELLSGLESTMAARASARDTAQRGEREQSELRAQFELLFSESPAALMLVDPSGTIVRHNVLAQRLFDLGADTPATIGALLGTSMHDVATRMHDSNDAVEAGSAPTFNATMEGTSAAGRPVLVAVQVSPIRFGDQPHALVGAVDVGERVAAQRALQGALSEKVTLLQEVHHRVKNNLQIVSSLLGLQADRTDSGEARVALLESVQRVRTMALIHQQLYGGDSFARIDFDTYARKLIAELCAALDPTARARLDCASVELVLANALPCGLILNEIVTNTLKHGRSTDGICRFTVTVRPHEGQLLMEVRDEGAGLSAPWRELRRRSLGGSIIDALVRQLRATLEVESEPGGGARFRLTAPLEPGR
jgi:PAS domain S-box-containing protein